MFGRFRFLVRRQRFEENLADEVSFHLETRIEDLVSRGVPREQAERRARLEFGSVDAYKERCRESGGLRPFDELAQDLRYAFRVYRKSPGVAALAILCLALGIGANTSVFSMMNYLMLKPLPVPGAERVVVLERGPRTDLSYPYYRAYRDRSRSFSGLAASQPTESTLDIGNEASGAAAEAVSANYASVLRLRAHLGRWFDNENEAAAVVSYRVWQKRFNGDPNVLGKIVRSEKRYWTVVGVAPPEYSGIYSPLSTDLWVPLRLWAEQYPTVIAGLADYTRAQVMSVGRLREGVSPEQATAELNAIDVRAREENGDKRPRQPLLANPARGILPKHFRHGAGPLSVLLMAVGTVVLFIACLNVANLLLAKGIARQTEIGVRMSLGAGLRRVFRQMLAESLLLSVFGAAAGLLAGQWMNGLIRAMFAAMPLGEVVRLDLSFDERVFWDAWAASLIATLMCGLGPAWRATRIDVVRTIKGGGTQGDLLKMQRVVLVGQVAMSLALLCCASMFLRAWSQLRAADPGFAVKQRLFAEVFVSEPEFTPESAQEFYHTAVDRLRALPGVEGAAQAYILPPFGRQANCVGVRGGAPVRVPVGRVGDGFLAVLNVAVRNGREFTRADRGSAAGIVVNETLARRLWPGGGAVGQEALVGCETPLPMAVVGVARDIKPGEAHLFEPLGRTASGLMNLVIASAAPAQEAAARVRRALERPGVRVYAVKPLADHVERTFWQVRWEAAMLGVFGGLALLLAAVGLYGAMAYYVTQRTRELGIRMALGAGTRGVLWCVCLRGLRLTVIGVAIGIVISVAAGRVLARFLFGVNPIGWDSLLGSAALWIAVAGAACLVPALRAARIPAVLALRQE